MDLSRLFSTEIYRVSLTPARGNARLNADLVQTALMFAEEDRAGQSWCDQHDFEGYTSYASLDDLPRRATCFADLSRQISKHAGAFAEALEMDLAGQKLVLDDLWVSVLNPGGGHAGHIHPRSIISGTYYAALPLKGARIRFEDPRLAMMMAAPQPLENSRPEHRRFIYLEPEVGELLMWEGWLRHEVPPSRGQEFRVSVSFNFGCR
ncbi:MAG: TIGR02466 family protein [Alphaproteobacteria bacterium]|nr:TIGR02466 family protein [Alphaproteobacteria bacterium]